MKGAQIKAMLVEGHNYRDIASKLDVSFSTISYHAKRAGLQKYSLPSRQHNWSEIQSFFDGGHGIREIKRHFHIDGETLKNARDRGNLILGRRQIDPAIIFIENSPYATSVIRRIIRRQSLLPYYCHEESCALNKIFEPEWASRPLVLQIDHINGRNHDHRLTNLRWLCPNCHTQTSTYCGRNRGDGGR